MTKLRLAALIVVVIAATGAGIGARSLAGAGDGIPPARRNSTAPTPAPQVVVDGALGGQVPWDQPLRLRVLHATVGAVSVQDETGTSITGTVGPDGVWQTTSTLVPLTRYAIDVEAVGRRHHVSHQSVSVQTTDAVRHLVRSVPSVPRNDDDHAHVGHMFHYVAG